LVPAPAASGVLLEEGEVVWLGAVAGGSPASEGLRGVATDEAAGVVVPGLVGDDSRHRRAAVGVDGLGERGYTAPVRCRMKFLPT